MVTARHLVKIKISLDDIEDQSWGSWNTTDCLKGLVFRVRKGRYNKYAKKYRWSLEFKNRYQKNIYFTYKAVAPSQKYAIRQSGKTIYRISLDANGGKRATYALVKSSSSVYIYVNRIRINKKDVGRYYGCDK